MDLLNRGKVFASREHSEKGVELKLKIALPGKTCLAVPGDWILKDCANEDEKTGYTDATIDITRYKK